MRDLLAENILLMAIKRTSDTTGTLFTYNSSPNLSTPISENDSLRYVGNRMLFKCFKGKPVKLVPLTTADLVSTLDVGVLAYFALDLNNGNIHELYGVEQLFTYLGICPAEFDDVMGKYGNQPPAPPYSKNVKKSMG